MTRQRVMDAANKLSYVPNNMARSLKLSSSSIVGVILPDITNVFYPRTVSYTHLDVYKRQVH